MCGREVLLYNTQLDKICMQFLFERVQCWLHTYSQYPSSLHLVAMCLASGLYPDKISSKCIYNCSQTCFQFAILKAEPDIKDGIPAKFNSHLTMCIYFFLKTLSRENLVNINSNFYWLRFIIKGTKTKR